MIYTNNFLFADQNYMGQQSDSARDRTDESSTISVHNQETALASRCGAVGRANAHHSGDP